MKKILINAFVFLSVFSLTVYGVLRESDLSELSEAIRLCDERKLLPALLCVFLFICGEALILWILLNSCGYRIRKSFCFLFSSVGFFFSCVTPSASGGQPMQVWFMRKKKIPVPVATVILMLVTITYKLVLVLVGIGTVLFGRKTLLPLLENMLPVYYLGLFLNIVCVLVMLMLLFEPGFMKKLLFRVLDLLERFPVVRNRNFRPRIDEAMETYSASAAYMKENQFLMAAVFFITVIQRFCLFAVTWFVYRSFGFRGDSFVRITVLTAMISVAVDMLPLPGGMGISEGLFLLIFGPAFGELLLPGMVLSRGLSYYSELVISAIFTLLAFMLFGRKKKCDVGVK